MKAAPEVLNTIADKVLSYRPERKMKKPPKAKKTVIKKKTKQKAD